jgi:CheY-like chemotaxis protein
LLTAILTRRGFAVHAVKNGAEAIDAIVAADFDAIILDLMMPIVDGFEVITHLERVAPRSLKHCVIVLTAASTKDLGKLDGKKVFRVIRKPFDLDQLVEIVTECVDDHDEQPIIRSQPG